MSHDYQSFSHYFLYKLDDKINARRIISPPVYTESSSENVIWSSSAFAVSIVSLPATATVTMKPSRYVSVDSNSSYGYFVSFVASVLGSLNIRAFTR